MTAALLTPRVRIMAICDGVRESKSEAGVFHLKGVRQEIRAETFPFAPARLWLFVLLSSRGAGEFPCYVRVVNDQTNKIVYYSYVDPRPAFGSDGGIFATTAPIHCNFPQPGSYTVQVWFFQEQDSDVLKGETPLYVLKGDGI